MLVYCPPKWRRSLISIGIVALFLLPAFLIFYTSKVLAAPPDSCKVNYPPNQGSLSVSGDTATYSAGRQDNSEWFRFVVYEAQNYEEPLWSETRLYTNNSFQLDLSDPDFCEKDLEFTHHLRWQSSANVCTFYPFLDGPDAAAQTECEPPTCAPQSVQDAPDGQKCQADPGVGTCRDRRNNESKPADARFLSNPVSCKNRPPTCEITKNPDKEEYNRLEDMELTIVGSDPDGDDLTYRWVLAECGTMDTTSVPTTTYRTPNVNDATCRITAEVDDGEESASCFIEITTISAEIQVELDDLSIDRSNTPKLGTTELRVVLENTESGTAQINTWSIQIQGDDGEMRDNICVQPNVTCEFDDGSTSVSVPIGESTHQVTVTIPQTLDPTQAYGIKVNVSSTKPDGSSMDGSTTAVVTLTNNAPVCGTPQMTFNCADGGDDCVVELPNVFRLNDDIEVEGNASDPDGDGVVYKDWDVNGAGEVGSLSSTTGKTVTYTSPPYFGQTNTVEYTAEDEWGLEAENVCQRDIKTERSFTIAEGRVFTVTADADDTDEEVCESITPGVGSYDGIEGVGLQDKTYSGSDFDHLKVETDNNGNFNNLEVKVGEDDNGDKFVEFCLLDLPHQDYSVVACTLPKGLDIVTTKLETDCLRLRDDGHDIDRGETLDKFNIAVRFTYKPFLTIRGGDVLSQSSVRDVTLNVPGNLNDYEYFISKSDDFSKKHGTLVAGSGVTSDWGNNKTDFTVVQGVRNYNSSSHIQNAMGILIGNLKKYKEEGILTGNVIFIEGDVTLTQSDFTGANDYSDKILVVDGNVTIENQACPAADAEINVVILATGTVILDKEACPNKKRTVRIYGVLASGIEGNSANGEMSLDYEIEVESPDDPAYHRPSIEVILDPKYFVHPNYDYIKITTVNMMELVR